MQATQGTQSCIWGAGWCPKGQRKEAVQESEARRELQRACGVCELWSTNEGGKHSFVRRDLHESVQLQVDTFATSAFKGTFYQVDDGQGSASRKKVVSPSSKCVLIYSNASRTPSGTRTRTCYDRSNQEEPRVRRGGRY